MEEILSTEKYEPGSEKFGVRQTFKDFFPERGCILFVRPVNDESLLQRIETLDKATLRPEFLGALEEFKARISQSLAPKTFGGRVLDGNGFLAMVGEILACFNDRETPQLLGVIERLRGEEKRRRRAELQEWVNRFLHENVGREGLARKAVAQLLAQTLAKEGHAPGMEEELFLESWAYFQAELAAKAEYAQVVRTKRLAKALEEARSDPSLGPAEVLQALLASGDLGAARFSLKEVGETVLKRLLDSQKSRSKQELQQLQEAMREKELDLQHEKKKAELTEQEARNWRKAIEAGEEEARDLRVRLKNQKEEMQVLRGAQTGEADLVLQLELVTGQKTELEKEVARLREAGPGGARPANLEDLLGGLGGEGGGEEVRLMVQAMREELMAENENLREKIEELGHQNQNLKMEITDVSGSKDREIERWADQAAQGNHGAELLQRPPGGLHPRAQREQQDEGAEAADVLPVQGTHSQAQEEKELARQRAQND